MFSTHQINPRPNARILKTGMTKLSKRQPSECAGWGITPTHHLLATGLGPIPNEKYVFGEGLTESLATQLPSSFT
jgi:hypothetical protein